MKEYRTKDFYLSCVLLSKGIKLINSDKMPDVNTVYFNFDISEKDELKNSIINDFINQNCMVELKSFTHSMKILRSELNKHKNGGIK